MDMKTYLHKSVSLLMALVVFISTTGFTIYEHHCNCTDTVQTNLFVEESDCCHQEPVSCCDLEQHACVLDGQAPGHDCCTSSMNYIKINTPVDLPVQKKSLMHSLKLCALQEIILEDSQIEDDPALNREVSTDIYRPHGPDLLIRYHQLKIAPPSA
jgi:hypothetical protein